MLLLLLALAVSSLAAVKKKRFDVDAAAVSRTQTVAEQDSVGAPLKDSVTLAIKGDAGFNFMASLSQAQKQLREKVTASILLIKSGNVSAVGGFLLICLIYGMLHALGPGHGKSIVVGYFLARKGRWLQGAALGAGITFAHTLSAVLLLFSLYLIFKATVFSAFEMGRLGVEKISYGLVIFTGLLLICIGLRDFWKLRKKTSAKESGILPTEASWREIIGVAAVTGMVPCPAVALIVLFCLLNSMVLISLAGALAICVGMTFTNICFGLVAVALRKSIDKGVAKSSPHGIWVSGIYAAFSVFGGLLVFISGLMLFGNLLV